ncbi:MAG TPA: hypothetical protein VH817_13955 [Thermoleophilaceae bacterium]
MSQDPLERRDVNLWVRTDCVGAPGVELFERVGRIAGEHHVPA